MLKLVKPRKEAVTELYPPFLYRSGDSEFE
jgi:hypothetical protein